MATRYAVMSFIACKRIEAGCVMKHTLALATQPRFNHKTSRFLRLCRKEELHEHEEKGVRTEYGA